MLSSNVQSTDLLMDCTAWRFSTMRQPNGCSTPAPKSSAAKQWIEELAQKKKTHLYPPHNSSVYLTTITYVRRTGRITNGMRSGLSTLRDSVPSSPTPAPTSPEWPSHQYGSGLTASASLSGVSVPSYTNRVWPPLRPVSVVQKNKPSTMSSNVQSIDLPMECMQHGLTVLNGETIEWLLNICPEI